ncbi:MAG: M56 family metallopeptidase [Planctomycetota bacterium]
MNILTSYLFCLDRVFYAILVLSLYGSTMVVAVFVLQKFFSRTLSPKWIYAIWMLAIVRFILIVAPASPASFQNWIAKSEKSELTISNVYLDSEFTTSGEWTVSNSPGSSVLATPIESAVPYSSVSRIMALAWAAGFSILIWRFVKSCRRTQEIIRSAHHASKSIQDIFGEAKSWTNHGGNVPILITNQIDTPAACGVFRPKVLLPEWCIDQLDGDELRLIFVHELTHLKKKDVWIQLTANLISIAHWFNPLVAFAIRKLEVYREMACDQRSLELLTKFNVDQPKVAYGNVILRVATYCSAQSPSPEPLLVGSFVDTNKQQIQERISMLIQLKPRKATTSLLAVCIILLMLVVGFTSEQTVEGQKQLPSPASLAWPALAELSEESEPVSNVKVLPTATSSAAPSKSLPAAPETSTGLFGTVEGTTIGMNETQIIEFDKRIEVVCAPDPEIATVTPVGPNHLMIRGESHGRSVLTMIFHHSEEQKTFTIEVGAGTLEPKLVNLDLKIIAMDQADMSEVSADFNFAEKARPARTPGGVEIMTAEPYLDLRYGICQFKELGKDSYATKLIRRIEKHLPEAGVVVAPKLTTLMSQEATFHLGGRLPLENAHHDGNSDEFKPFGTIVSITPNTTIDPERVTLQIEFELSKQSGSEIVILRRFNTIQQLHYGNTMAMASSYTEDGVEKGILLLVTPSLIEQSFSD